LSSTQIDLHAPVPHLNGTHELAGGVTHAPAPSQVDAGVSVTPLAGHVAAPHGVP
jgi:sortase (surface protein transpeptidase)